MPCRLTRAAYHHDVIQALRARGRATFELVPWSDTRFQGLSATERAGWNVSMMLAEQSGRPNRVLDVAVRVLLDNWQLPTVTAVSSVALSHEPLAQFVMDGNGTTRSFMLNSQPMRIACLSLAGMIGTDPGCNSITFFERRMAAPFTEITTTYQDLSAVTVATFQNAAMFGTSLRGPWTIDIQNILDQLRAYQAANPGYNGCAPGNSCNAEESFWQRFRGIELKVFWVPTS